MTKGWFSFIQNRMCITCLKLKIDNCRPGTSPHTVSDCGKNWDALTGAIFQDLTTIVKFQEKKQKNLCDIHRWFLYQYEGEVVERMKNNMNNCMEVLDEKKETIQEGSYLEKSDMLKKFYDLFSNMYECAMELDDAVDGDDDWDGEGDGHSIHGETQWFPVAAGGRDGH